MPKYPYALILFLVFLTLKLTGTVTWSWLAVTSPLWIVAGVLVLCFLGIGVIAYAETTKADKEKARK